MATNNHCLEETNPVIVVIIPFPIHSHMNQVLQLSVLISSYNIPVHYAGSSIHNSQIRTRAHHLHEQLSRIQFHDFQIPPLSPDSSRFMFIHAMEHLRKPVALLLHELSKKAKRIIVIHDSLASSVVQDWTCIPNAEPYMFLPTTTFCVLSQIISQESGKYLTIPNELAHDDNFNYDPIEVPYVEGTVCKEISDFMDYQEQFAQNSVGILNNACRFVDGIFVDMLVKKLNKTIWPVGPLHQITSRNRKCYNSISGKDRWLLDWLDKQEPNSVLYISFGTTISMAHHDEQLQELATGLELSETKFIWVFRDADIEDPDFNGEKGELPKGFEERMRAKGIGMVVRDWAPQLEILEHKSTGGFLSHCGWNSCLESISCGVPIAAWPMHTDQPANALLITKVLKVGLNVKEWERRHEPVSSSTINKALRRLMGPDEGAEMRKRAQDLGAKVRNATADGGVSCLECDSFIAHITRQI
ncbi:zeatin O-xylosyltransferase-like [Ziziphus jujuba]|uniref:Glycosyltransferase n=1 Tax=Ziziphus jujuba TaxID=326968 RepID=A0A6P3ZNH7_ZIZJJ|nr:zeatin O-xylosyltransferase-like [Ziziphus jujuba]